MIRIAREAKALLEPIAVAPPEVYVPLLKPRDADYAAVFVGDAAARARDGYESLWANPPRSLGKHDQTNVFTFASEASQLGGENDYSVEFPGGYRKVASLFVPERVWVVWKLTVPGQTTGMRYDGLVYLGDHWAWFPKPWRIVDEVN